MAAAISPKFKEFMEYAIAQGLDGDFINNFWSQYGEQSLDYLRSNYELVMQYGRPGPRPQAARPPQFRGGAGAQPLFPEEMQVHLAQPNASVPRPPAAPQYQIGAPAPALIPAPAPAFPPAPPAGPPAVQPVLPPLPEPHGTAREVLVANVSRFSRTEHQGMIPTFTHVGSARQPLLRENFIAAAQVWCTFLGPTDWEIAFAAFPTYHFSITLNQNLLQANRTKGQQYFAGRTTQQEQSKPYKDKVNLLQSWNAILSRIQQESRVSPDQIGLNWGTLFQTRYWNDVFPSAYKIADQCKPNAAWMKQKHAYWAGRTEQDAADLVLTYTTILCALEPMMSPEFNFSPDAKAWYNAPARQADFDSGDVKEMVRAHNKDGGFSLMCLRAAYAVDFYKATSCGVMKKSGGKILGPAIAKGMMSIVRAYITKMPATGLTGHDRLYVHDGVLHILGPASFDPTDDFVKSYRLVKKWLGIQIKMLKTKVTGQTRGVFKKNTIALTGVNEETITRVDPGLLPRPPPMPAPAPVPMPAPAPAAAPAPVVEPVVPTAPLNLPQTQPKTGGGGKKEKKGPTGAAAAAST